MLEQDQELIDSIKRDVFSQVKESDLLESQENVVLSPGKSICMGF